MTSNVAKLRLEEPVRFESERLEVLCLELGEDGAEQVIAQALEQIAVKISQVDALWQARDLDEIIFVCKGLSRAAGRIGMTTLARVARDVRLCAEAGAFIPLEATIERLQRIGDQSVHAIWPLEDISG